VTAVSDPTGEAGQSDQPDHPDQLERPIFVVGDRAVVARPPERLLELLEL
jgi:hypothetical protein